MKKAVLYWVSNQLFKYYLVNGGWSNWNAFSECSRTCGGGVKFRSRVCNNPPPDSDGLQCDPTKSTESMACNVQDCPCKFFLITCMQFNHKDFNIFVKHVDWNFYFF